MPAHDLERKTVGGHRPPLQNLNLVPKLHSDTGESYRCRIGTHTQTNFTEKIV
jgi:hypothetical protein